MSMVVHILSAVYAALGIGYSFVLFGMGQIMLDPYRRDVLIMGLFYLLVTICVVLSILIWTRRRWAMLGLVLFSLLPLYAAWEAIWSVLAPFSGVFAILTAAAYVASDK
jgi:hypothetical protein